MDQCGSGLSHRSQALVPVHTKKFYVIHNNDFVLGNGDASNLGRSGEASLFCACPGVLVSLVIEDS